jgi:hypothetical protein
LIALDHPVVASLLPVALYFAVAAGLFFGLLVVIAG